MSVDFRNMSFLCGWYELCRLNEEVTKLSKKIQTQRATKDNFLQMAVDYLVVLTCFTGGLRNLSVCCFVTEYRPWLCCQRLSSILLKGILYNWLAKSRSLQEKWSCSTVLGHCSITSWKFSMSGFDLWRHLPVCWNYGWRCLWRSSGQWKFFGCSCGWLGVRWDIFLRELQVTDQNQARSVVRCLWPICCKLWGWKGYLNLCNDTALQATNTLMFSFCERGLRHCSVGFDFCIGSLRLLYLLYLHVHEDSVKKSELAICQFQSTDNGC